MSDPYFIEVDQNGCHHCGSGRTWCIVGPDGAQMGMRWTASEEDIVRGEPPEDAQMMCEALNDAYETGRVNAQIDDATLAAMVDRFLCWRLPDTFGPDGGITFTRPTHPNSWPVGTNLLTAVEARAMLEHVLRVRLPSPPPPKGDV